MSAQRSQRPTLCSTECQKREAAQTTRLPGSLNINWALLKEGESPRKVEEKGAIIFAFYQRKNDSENVIVKVHC